LPVIQAHKPHCDGAAHLSQISLQPLVYVRVVQRGVSCVHPKGKVKATVSPKAFPGTVVGPGALGENGGVVGEYADSGGKVWG